MQRLSQRLIESGNYFFSEPLRLSGIDSNITFQGSSKGRTRFHSLIRLEEWKEIEVNGRLCWTTHLPAVLRKNKVFRSLFVNGDRRSRSLSNSTGWHHFDDVPDIDFKKQFTLSSLYDGNDEVLIPEGLLSRESKNIQHIEFIVSHFWVMERLFVESYDPESR